MKLAIPFISTKPKTDLEILIALTPIWWILGLEQMLWPFALFWIFIKVIVFNKGRVKIDLLVLAFFLFLTMQLFSVFAIDRDYRILVFLRNFAIFLSAFFLVFIIYNSYHDWRDAKRLIVIAIAVIAFSTMLGLLGVSNIWRPDFQSPLSSFLPSWIVDSEHGSKLALRSIGRPGEFLSFSHYRLNGFALYPNEYATILVAFIPLVIYTIKQKNRILLKILWGIILISFITNLLFTTSRGAILSLCIGFVFYQFFAPQKSQVLRWASIFIAFSLGMLLFVLSEDISQGVTTFFTTRSTDSRLREYLLSLEWWLKKPLFGWGVSLASEVEGILGIPLGSHSYYLAILFRYGLFGLLTFSFVYFMLWLKTKPLVFESDTPSFTEMKDFLYFGRWTLVSLLFDGITTIQTTDALVFILIWTLLALLITTRRNLIASL